jgi:hypothetical protein
MDDRIEIILILAIIVLGSFSVSIFGGFSLSEEVNWYYRQGYKIQDLLYDDFLSELDPDIIITEHYVARKGVRIQAEIYNQVDPVVIFYDGEKQIIYFLAQWSSHSKRALIFIWRASFR